MTRLAWVPYALFIMAEIAASCGGDSGGHGGGGGGGGSRPVELARRESFEPIETGMEPTTSPPV